MTPTEQAVRAWQSADDAASLIDARIDQRVRAAGAVQIEAPPQALRALNVMQLAEHRLRFGLILGLVR